jgi:hypothetical protein
VALVAFAMVQQRATSSAAPAINKDHWHSAQAVWICDHFYEVPLTDVGEDKLGIHTHGDGLIHIHPFSANASGENATLSVFGKPLSAPILISSMTGGTAEAETINLRLAEAAQEMQIAMGVGSQRAAIEHPEQAKTFQVRRVASDILLFANLGRFNSITVWHR